MIRLVAGKSQAPILMWVSVKLSTLVNVPSVGE